MRLKRFGIRKILATFCLVACAVFIFEYQSRAAAHKVFGNMSYYTSSPYIVEKMTLKNGAATAYNGLLYYTYVYDRRYVYGDFNKDGLKDAAVLVYDGEENAGGYDLAFLINDGNQLVHRGSYYLGRWVAIKSLRERDGKVLVRKLVSEGDDWAAGRDRSVIEIYDYLNPRLDIQRYPLDQTDQTDQTELMLA